MNKTTSKKDAVLPKRCFSCIHWKNNQALLNYSSLNGFCVNDKFRFNLNDDRLIGIIDHDNLKDRDEIWGNPSHDIETRCYTPVKVKISRYSLQTNENFGCIFHEADRKPLI